MMLRQWGLVGLGVALSYVGVGPATAQTLQLERSGNVFHAAVCARGNPAGTARCYAHVVTDARGNPHNGKATPAATPSGYGPADLQSAYNLAAAAASGGAGQTVAIVDAYDDSTAEAEQFQAETVAPGTLRWLDELRPLQCTDQPVDGGPRLVRGQPPRRCMALPA